MASVAVTIAEPPIQMVAVMAAAPTASVAAPIKDHALAVLMGQNNDDIITPSDLEGFTEHASDLLEWLDASKLKELRDKKLDSAAFARELVATILQTPLPQQENADNCNCSHGHKGLIALALAGYIGGMIAASLNQDDLSTACFVVAAVATVGFGIARCRHHAATQEMTALFSRYSAKYRELALRHATLPKAGI